MSCENTEDEGQSSSEESSDSNFTITFDDDRQEETASRTPMEPEKENPVESHEEDEDSPIASRTRAAKYSPRQRRRMKAGAARRGSGCI